MLKTRSQKANRHIRTKRSYQQARSKTAPHRAVTTPDRTPSPNRTLEDWLAAKSDVRTETFSLYFLQFY